MLRRRDILKASPLVPIALRSEPFDALIADLEKRIPLALKDLRVPGASIALVTDAKIAWRKGFGYKDAASGVPVDETTCFEAASMSKPVFAYAAMKLCERGVLDLDKPLSKYTSERFLKDDPRSDEITVRHVLSHTTGFQNWRSPQHPLKISAAPGSKYGYSGEGFHYLQTVMTKLTGTTDTSQYDKYEDAVQVCATDFDSYLRKNLLEPLGMKSSGYVRNKYFEKHMARPHDEKGQPLKQKKSRAVDVARYGSAGALLTTPADYAKFLIATLDPQPANAHRLTRPTIQQMLRPQVNLEKTPEYSIDWGLGWRLAHTKSADLFGHGGDNSGFHCLSEGCLKTRTAFVIMTNGEGGVELLKRIAPPLSQRLHAG